MCMAGGFVLGEVLALLPEDVGWMILVMLVPGLLWLCMNMYRSGRSSRRPWEWGLLFLCCVCGWLGMSGYQKDGAELEALRLADGKRVWVRGTIEKLEEKEKSYGLTLSDCRLVVRKSEETWRGRKDELGKLPGNQPGNQMEYPIPDMIVYAEREKFERVNHVRLVRLGMEAAVFGELKEPSRARNPGEFDFREYYRAMGIRLQMFGEDFQIRDGKYWWYRDWLYRMRTAAGAVLEDICGPEDLGIFQAAILGDKTALDEGVRRLYQRNGIAHLLAISGLHISLVGMFVYRTLRRCGAGYGAAGILGAVVIVSYGIFTGGSSSVARAVLMILVLILAGYLGRSYDLLSSAGLACILILLQYPGLVTQAGFLLSFGAVAAIGGLGPWMAEKLEVKSGFGKTVILGASVQLVTSPVIVYSFYQYPVYGILLNFVVIPLMGYVVVSGILGIVLGAVWRPAGVLAVGSGHYILEFYRWLCLMAERLPGANLVMGKPRLWQIGMYGAAMALLLWYVCGRKGRGREKREKARGPYPGSLFKPVIILTIGSVLSFLIMLPIPIKGMEVTFLDVGQGDGICIRTREAVILVDGGSTDRKELGKNTLEPYLKSLGITRVDYAVISHADSDHISGIQYLLEEQEDIRVKNLVLPWLGREDESYEPLVRLMEDHGGRIHWMQAGERIAAGKLSISCLYHGNEKRKEERNEHSLVLKVDYEQTGILLTGDMSQDGEREMIDENRLNTGGSDIQILKAAHHGSKYSSCQEFLHLISPEWTVISCGEGNSYGHPHKETLERIKEAGSRILVTEDTGAVVVHVEASVSVCSFVLLR